MTYGIRIPYGARDVGLLSAPGSDLQVQHGAEIAVDWASPERECVALELRVQWMGAYGMGANIPVVRYRLELGHGSRSIILPQRPASPSIAAGGLSSPMPMMPAAGLLERFECRTARVALLFEQTNPVDEPDAHVVLGVSMQPIAGVSAFSPVSRTSFDASQFIAIPPGATMVRGQDAIGGGISNTRFRNIHGATLGNIGSGQLVNGVLIPLQAAFVQLSGVGIGAALRFT